MDFLTDFFTPEPAPAETPAPKTKKPQAKKRLQPEETTPVVTPEAPKAKRTRKPKTHEIESVKQGRKITIFDPAIYNLGIARLELDTGKVDQLMRINLVKDLETYKKHLIKAEKAKKEGKKAKPFKPTGREIRRLIYQFLRSHRAQIQADAYYVEKQHFPQNKVVEETLTHYLYPLSDTLSPEAVKQHIQKLVPHIRRPMKGDADKTPKSDKVWICQAMRALITDADILRTFGETDDDVYDCLGMGQYVRDTKKAFPFQETTDTAMIFNTM